MYNKSICISTAYNLFPMLKAIHFFHTVDTFYHIYTKNIYVMLHYWRLCCWKMVKTCMSSQYQHTCTCIFEFQWTRLTEASEEVHEQCSWKIQSLAAREEKKGHRKKKTSHYFTLYFFMSSSKQTFPVSWTGKKETKENHVGKGRVGSVASIPKKVWRESGENCWLPSLVFLFPLFCKQSKLLHVSLFTYPQSWEFNWCTHI